MPISIDDLFAKPSPKTVENPAFGYQPAPMSASDDSQKLEHLSVKIEQLVHITSELVHAWTEGNDKAKLYAEQVAFDKVAGDLKDIGSGAASVAFLTGNYQLSRQIKVVTEQAFNVGMQIAGIAKYGTLAATANPITLGVTLLSAAASISEVFSPQKDPIMPMLTNILTQLGNQHQEIMAEMAFRHIDLKAQIGEMGLEVVTQFATLGKKVDNIQETLDLLHQNVVANSIQTKHILNGFSQSMAQVKEMLLDKTTKDMIDVISKPINRIVFNGSGGYINEATIREVVSELLVSVKVTSKRSEVAGAGAVPDHLSMSEWKVSGQSAHFADYHINELRAIASSVLPQNSVVSASINNPLLWAYSTLALLMLYRKLYSTVPEHKNRIHKVEVQNVKTVIIEGQQTQELLTQLRNPQLYELLLTELQASLVKLQTCYQENLMEFRVEQVKEIGLAIKKKNSDLSEIHVRAVQYQRIEVNGLYHQWFDGYSNFRGNGTRSYMTLKPGGPGGDSGYQHHAGLALETYVKTAQAQITEQKTAYLGSYGFGIYPEPDFDGPVLPITEALVNKIKSLLPKEITGAVELNLGSLYFRYFIDDKKQFHLVTYFEDKACHHLSTQYNALFYKGSEAIWWYWVGGRIPTDVFCNVVYAFTGIGSTGTHFYDYAIYHPMLQIRPAALSLIESKPFWANQVSEEDVAEISAAAGQLIELKQEQLQKSFNLEVRNNFKSDTDSPLGLAITEYFAKFKCLKTFLALCWHDEYEKQNSELRGLLRAIEIPGEREDIAGSREEMVAYLQKNEAEDGLDFFKQAIVLITLLKQYLPKIIEQQRPSYYSIIEKVTDECCRFVEDYLPTQADANRVIPFDESDTEATKDEKIVKERAQYAMAKSMIMSMLETLHMLNLTEEQTEKYLAASFANFKRKNPEVTVEFSPAMLLAASKGNPIFDGGRSLTEGASAGPAARGGVDQHMP